VMAHFVWAGERKIPQKSKIWMLRVSGGELWCDFWLIKSVLISGGYGQAVKMIGHMEWRRSTRQSLSHWQRNLARLSLMTSRTVS